jgi:hypothetical protein
LWVGDKMKKKKRMNPDVMVKIGLTVVIAVIISMFVLVDIWSDNKGKEEVVKQKQCWKDIYAIIDASPQNKADFVEVAIQDRMKYLKGVDYCSALKFLKNRQGKIKKSYLVQGAEEYQARESSHACNL